MQFKKIAWFISLPFVYLYFVLCILLTKNKARKYKKNPSDFIDDEKYDSVYRLCRLYLYTKNIKLDYFNKEDDKILCKSQLLISNHRSILDAILIYVFVYKQTNIRPIFVAKKELENSYFSFAFDLIDTIYIDRDNLRQMVATIDIQKEYLKNNKMIILFPEGSRNTHEELLDFKSGAFEVAYKAMVPIQPVILANQEQYVENKVNINKRKPIKFKLLSPIQPSYFFQIDRNILSKNLRNDMQKEYNNLK